jgi:hypothetical protein
MMHL